MEYYSATKTEIVPSVKTGMDLEGIMLSEINQTEKGKYCMFSLICGTLKNKTKKQNENRLIFIENKLVVPRRQWSGWLVDIGKAIKEEQTSSD